MISHIVGFLILENHEDISSSSLNQLLAHFPWLKRELLTIGQTRLWVWGHGDIKSAIHTHDSGETYILIGYPPNFMGWDALISTANIEQTISKWNGRFILLKISKDGSTWRFWNDWVGSIPVFYTYEPSQNRVASTLESIVVELARYSSDDFFLPGLLSLFINGHYLGEWTLYKSMYTILPDTEAVWDRAGFRNKPLNSVQASDTRWDKGWDELAQEMYELTESAILETLKLGSTWILPLSGGMDSRLIAAVGSKYHAEIQAYTYGSPGFHDVIYGRRVAKALRIPWNYIPLKADYLNRYTQLWALWFGSAMHFHGMYQMPFLNALDTSHEGQLLQGFMGDPLAGNHLTDLDRTYNSTDDFRPLTLGIYLWTYHELKKLFRFPIDEAYKTYMDYLDEQMTQTAGVAFQKQMFVDFRNRQRLLIFYQPKMYDYWRGVFTPFFNRTYANFCLSLPRLALENRQLQIYMLKRYFPNMARIGATYSLRPLELSSKYLLKRAVKDFIPRPLRLGPFREFNTSPNTFHADCIKQGGNEALWPISNKLDALSDWVDMSMVDQVHQIVIKGDNRSTLKLTAVQTLAHRL